ncbi:hypothetical protein SA111250134_00107 [Staphylococcus aureus]|nr:hypothetical protein SA111250134_00107 [Staphylococcus aureus]
MSVEIGNPISLCWGPAPTRIACRISFRNSLCWALTRIEKSLLQAHFRSVNYCQYNFVDHRRLIYFPAYSFHKKRRINYPSFSYIFL